jgi:hypothetical protein
MTATTLPAPVRAGRPRTALLASGIATLVVALVLLGAGGVAAAALGERDASGFFTGDAHAFSGSGRALVSDDLDLDDLPSWVGDNLATIRIEAASTGPAFLGIARSSDVDRYLAGVAHDRVTDVETDPFAAEYERVDGTRTPVPPASRGFWRVRDSGPGTVSVTWPLEAGDWTVVAMNADGSPGVDVDARFGVEVGALGWIAGIGLAGGGLALLGGATLVFLAARRNRP